MDFAQLILYNVGPLFSSALPAALNREVAAETLRCQFGEGESFKFQQQADERRSEKK